MYKLSLSSLFAVIILMLVGGQTASAYSLDRVSGNDRYQTSVAVSKKGWKSGAKTVILVNGRIFQKLLLLHRSPSIWMPRCF